MEILKLRALLSRRECKGMSLVRVLLCVLGFHKYDPEPDRYYSNRCVRCGHSPLTGEVSRVNFDKLKERR